jgi:hypothetical protein
MSTTEYGVVSDIARGADWLDDGNGNFTQLRRSASPQWGYKASTTSGLTYGYFGGQAWTGSAWSTVADGTTALTDNTTNYVERTAAGVVSVVGSNFTAMAIVVTVSGVITTFTDARRELVPNDATKASLTGATFSGDVNVPDEAYDATAWNGSMEAPTKNAVRDKIEALDTSLQNQIDDLADGSSGTHSEGISFTRVGDGVLEVGDSGDYRLERSGTINRVTMKGNAVGDAECDVLVCPSASYPGGFVSIVASAPPTLTADAFSEDSTLTGWTTALAADDWIRVVITDVDGVLTQLDCQLRVI